MPDSDDPKNDDPTHPGSRPAVHRQQQRVLEELSIEVGRLAQRLPLVVAGLKAGVALPASDLRALVRDLREAGNQMRSAALLLEGGEAAGRRL